MLWMMMLACWSQEERVEQRQERTATAMQSHYDAAQTARDAVVAGDLSAARAAGEQVLKVIPVADLPESARPFEQQLKEAVTPLTTAATIEDAGLAVGQTLAACGACHQATGMAIVLPVNARPGQRAEQQEQMARHQWAAERMTHGLIEGSEGAFDEALMALVEAPMIPTGTPVDAQLTGDAVMLEVRIHDLAAQVASTDSPPERAVLYGRTLSTCAACHGLLRD